MRLDTILGLNVSNYTFTELEPSIGLDLYHTTNATHATLVFTHTDMDVNWIGFGISEMGHMKGSDIVTMSFTSTMTTTIEDRHVPFSTITVNSEGDRSYDNLYPFLDVHSDWELEQALGVDGCLYSSTNDTRRGVVVSRLLSTGDPHDRDIGSDAVPIIWAWGPSAVGFHQDRRNTMNGFRFKGSQPPNQPFVNEIGEYDGVIEWTADDITIAAQETDYVDVSWSPVNTSSSELHIIGAEIRNKHPNMHHITILKSGIIQFAFTDNEVMFFKHCGFPLGGNRTGVWTGTDDTVINIHYDNPKKTDGLQDSNTTIILYYLNADNHKEYDCGTISLGDVSVHMDIVPTSPDPLPYEMGHIPANVEFTHRQATCPKECTEKMNETIHIFAGFLHMHYYGHRIYIDHYDTAGNLTGAVGKSDFWDNGHQFTDPSIAFDLQPGESLQLHCGYNTANHNSSVSFDLDTSAEMCQAYLFYWPAKSYSAFGSQEEPEPLSVCGVHVYSEKLYTRCGNTYSENLQIGRNGSIFENVTFAAPIAGDTPAPVSKECSAFPFPDPTSTTSTTSATSTTSTTSATSTTSTTSATNGDPPTDSKNNQGDAGRAQGAILVVVTSLVAGLVVV